MEAILRGSDVAADYVASLRGLAANAKPPQQGTGRSQVSAAAFFWQLRRDAQELCKVHTVKLADRSIEQAAPEEGTLFLREQEVRRAVANLVQNAAEHTPAGGRITLALQWRVPMCTVVVEDEGQGFSQQALLHGTEPLYTENVSRTPEGHLGLGLAVAQQTACAHGGTVRVKNTAQGHGHVTMTLCAAQEELVEEGCAPNAEASLCATHGQERAQTMPRPHTVDI